MTMTLSPLVTPERIVARITALELERIAMYQHSVDHGDSAGSMSMLDNSRLIEIRRDLRKLFLLKRLVEGRCRLGEARPVGGRKGEPNRHYKGK